MKLPMHASQEFSDELLGRNGKLFGHHLSLLTPKIELEERVLSSNSIFRRATISPKYYWRIL